MTASARILNPPFPFWGGKSRWAPTINEMIGTVGVYAEPFFGSGAVLLRRKPSIREVVCDTSGHVVNFWRAMQLDFREVARWADYPSYHDDLTARHRWLMEWAELHSGKLKIDPMYCDPRAAGWWAWGQSNWIGTGFCVTPDDSKMPCIQCKPTGGKGVTVHRIDLPDGPVSIESVPDQIPHMSPKVPAGKGVSVQRETGLFPPDQIPYMSSQPPAGKGVSVQRQTGLFPDQIPKVNSDMRGGQGVTVHRNRLPGQPDGDDIGAGERLLPWFFALQQRMAKVMVLNRSWESALTDSVLGQAKSSPPTNVGILMDPPYLQENRTTMYPSDLEGHPDKATIDSYHWSVEHGGKYRIVYCCRVGDFPVPDGWKSMSRGFKGIKDDARRETSQDMLMFSPAALNHGPTQLEMGGF